MLVHSCYADDGNGDRIDVIDSAGCSNDIHLVGTPEYRTSLRLATKEVRVIITYSLSLTLSCRCTYSNSPTGLLCNYSAKSPYASNSTADVAVLQFVDDGVSKYYHQLSIATQLCIAHAKWRKSTPSSPFVVHSIRRGTNARCVIAAFHNSRGVARYANRFIKR